jgi:hypothetical protein
MTYSRIPNDVFLTRNYFSEGLEVKDAFFCALETFSRNGEFEKHNAARDTIFSPVCNNYLSKPF